MFMEVNTSTRTALRFAVRATAYADMASQENNLIVREAAITYYGRALEVLGSAMKDGVEVDDYVLMNIVVLDLFEVSFFVVQGQ
jgi:hypothetical protein